MRVFAFAALAIVIACSSTNNPDTDGGSTNDSGTTNPDSALPTYDASIPYDGALGTCLGASLLSDLGKTRLMVGASMADATAKAAPFDLRYTYISGGVADGAGPCASCATGCTAAGVSCSNKQTPGCGWWGCWQYDQDPPGAYARSYFSTAATNGEIPMITYYMILQASGVKEGAPEVTQAANDATFMARYYADWRFLLKQVGTAKVLFHFEPDFWGYAEQPGTDPHSEPAAVASANATDCGSEENSIAGFGHCIVSMVRKYAPSARIGFHASAWATNMDAAGNTNPSFDIAGAAKKTAAFLLACGADGSDYLVVEASDRDAGYYTSIGQNRWWDDTNAKLPTFHQDFAWLTALAEAANKPLIDWQLPVGNMSLANTNNAWHDNRVDYFFAHPDELVAAHVVGMAFGAGAGGQTTPETDNGNLIAKTKSYIASGGQKLCP